MYIEKQSEQIKKRIDEFGGKLYLEFGGKLFDDNHAARVLPGFEPDAKVKMLLELKDDAEIVIVINADKIKVTGKKMDQKMYYRHSDYVGGMKEATLREKLNKKPEEVIEHAVKGMLPKGPLGREMYTKLHVYVGAEHKHEAQKPEVLTF